MDGSTLMVPWPIALLTMLYAIVAASSTATVWQAWQAHRLQSIWWAGMWGGMAALVMSGLALMRPWARRLAVAVSWVMLASALGAAILAVTVGQPRPRYSFLATGIATIHLVIIRYLTRPRVKAWFVGIQDPRRETHVLSPES